MQYSPPLQTARALSLGLARGLGALLFDPLESRDLQPESSATGTAAAANKSGSLSFAAAARQLRGGQPVRSGRSGAATETDSSDDEGSLTGAGGEKADKDAGARGNSSLPQCYKVGFIALHCTRSRHESAICLGLLCIR